MTVKLAEIPVADVLAGKNWIAHFGHDEDGLRATVTESRKFTAEDSGLFSAIVTFGDGSQHPALVVKSFPRNGDDVDVYIHTKFGWLNLHAPGFMRAAGKYSHEIFPFDYCFAEPWKGGAQPQPDNTSTHPELFQRAAARLMAAESR